MIDDAVQQQMQAHQTALERACEMSLQSGQHGVLVTWSDPLTASYEVSEEVPYGWIFERHPFL
jgi:hypothetical protein